MATSKEKKKATTKGEMKNEIASIDRDIHNALFIGLEGLQILRNRDDTLLTRGRGLGLKLYEDLERDGHCFAVLDKRKKAVTSREWNVDPASDDPIDKAIALEVKEMLSNLKFDKLCKNLLDANLKGYAVAEIMWNVDKKKNLLVPTHFFARNQRRFVFDTNRNLRLLTPENRIDGEIMPDRKFIVHSVGGSDGDPYGLGLGAKLFWPVFFKRQNITFWLIFADKFGTPTATGKYPAGTSDGEQKKLLGMLRQISQDAGIIFPQGMEVGLLEASRTGPGDFYESLCRYMDEQISITVLGETLTTTSGDRGARSLGEVHDGVRMENAKDDADQLSDTLNEGLIQWIVDYNWPGRDAPTVWRNFDEEEDLKTRADRDKTLDEMGLELTDEEVVRVYGPGYRRKPKPATPDPRAFFPPQPGTGAPPAVSAPSTAKAGGPEDDDVPEFSERQRSMFKRFWDFITFADANGDIDQARKQNRASQQEIAEGADETAEQWQSFMQPRIDELRVLLDETGDLVQFRERLDELLNSEPPAEFREQLARAQFASHIIGRGKAE